jgi:hypothetical protein
MIEDGALKEKAGQRDVDTKSKAPQVRWNLGDLEFEAYMRMMDNAVSSTVRFIKNFLNKQTNRNLHKCKYPAPLLFFLFII